MKFTPDMVVESHRYIHKHDLYIGRFQPPHSGHAWCIRQMKNPIVGIVRGEKSDRRQSPFGYETVSRLIRKIAPNARLMEITHGYVPAILNDLRKEGIEVARVFAGEDRMNAYDRQLNTINEHLDYNHTFWAYVESFSRDIIPVAATDVRKALREGDQVSFRKMVPSEIWGEFDLLREQILIVDGARKIMEEEGAATSNSATEIAQKDIPLFKGKDRVSKRKPLEDKEENDKLTKS